MSPDRVKLGILYPDLDVLMQYALPNSLISSVTSEPRVSGANREVIVVGSLDVKIKIVEATRIVPCVLCEPRMSDPRSSKFMFHLAVQ